MTEWLEVVRDHWDHLPERVRTRVLLAVLAAVLLVTALVDDIPT